MKVSTLLYSTLLYSLISLNPMFSKNAGAVIPLCGPVRLEQLGSLDDGMLYNNDPEPLAVSTLRVGAVQYIGSSPDSEPVFLTSWVSPYGNNTHRGLYYAPWKVSGVNAVCTGNISLSTHYNNNINLDASFTQNVQWVKEGGFVKKGYLYSEYNTNTPYIGDHGYIAVSTSGNQEPVEINGKYSVGDRPQVRIYRMFGPNGSYLLSSRLEQILETRYGMYPDMAQAVLTPRFTLSDLNFMYCDEPDVYYDINNVTEPRSCKLRKNNVVNIVVYGGDVEFVKGGMYNQERPYVKSDYWVTHTVKYVLFDQSGKELASGEIEASRRPDSIIMRPNVVWNPGINRFVVQWESIENMSNNNEDILLRSATISFGKDGYGNMYTKVEYNSDYKEVCIYSLTKEGTLPMYRNQGCQLISYSLNADPDLSDDGREPPVHKDMILRNGYLAGDAYPGHWLNSYGSKVLYYAEDYVSNAISGSHPGSNLEPVYDYERLDNTTGEYKPVIFNQLIKKVYDDFSSRFFPYIAFYGKPVPDYFDNKMGITEMAYGNIDYNDPVNLKPETGYVMNSNDVPLGIGTASGEDGIPLSLFLYSVNLGTPEQPVRYVYFGASKWETN